MRFQRWAQGQPDNAGGSENCLAVDISGQAYAFKDESCTSTKRYICVAQDTTMSLTGGRNAQRECAANYGLNESESGFDQSI